MFFSSEWVNKPWSIHTTEYYSVTRKNKLLTHSHLEGSPGHQAQ